MKENSNRAIALLAHNVRSLWNVGSLFRTADAFGVMSIILSGYTPTPPRKEITKTAIGAEEIVAWKHVPDPLDALKDFRKRGFAIVALEIDEMSKELSTYTESRNCLLIIGNELGGIPPDILRECDAVLSIPMLGNKESLNVSVAAGIALYHLRFN